MIVETEAYAGVTDRASHAFGNRRTKRTEVMYARGGVAYVYLCYGMYALTNVVTHARDVPHAVLIRGLEPVEGTEAMLKRSGKLAMDYRLTAGPGVLSRALGLSPLHSGLSFSGPEIFLEDRGVKIPPEGIVASPRVGVAYAGEDAVLPWRYRIRGNPWTSPAK
jgi:DNA-3-methyladenine glycosylase